MKSRKPLIATLCLALLVLGWLVFRPELLFINATVNETLPAASNAPGAAKGTDKIIATGAFHSGAHETKGAASVHQFVDG